MTLLANLELIHCPNQLTRQRSRKKTTRNDAAIRNTIEFYEEAIKILPKLAHELTTARHKQELNPNKYENEQRRKSDKIFTLFKFFYQF